MQNLRNSCHHFFLLSHKLQKFIGIEGTEEEKLPKQPSITYCRVFAWECKIQLQKKSRHSEKFLDILESFQAPWFISRHSGGLLYTQESFHPLWEVFVHQSLLSETCSHFLSLLRNPKATMTPKTHRASRISDSRISLCSE